MKETVKEVLLSILPITIVITLLQVTIIQLPFEQFTPFLLGVVMVSVGLILFLIGVNMSLLPLGEMIGSALPKTNKVWVVVWVGFLLGVVVTIAEPDVRILSSQVEIVSEGAIPKPVLLLSVSLGVGIFISLAMLRIIFQMNLAYLLLAGYGIVFLLASITPPSYVPISFDSGGVTTGPLTVPFIMALGVGVASVMKRNTASKDAFGLVALASIGPIIAVLLLGVVYG
ncbi:DUF1538 domain-containing protein [Oceanobacillus manasiensis]|uniref:DUF1538 domain-containing protein n=1 Tax=Oceanobacillus manasiensis TaxID=586413 RepID=UPI0005A93715|nr:DUF1538 domain-containing protein [Oceanobacillus manasiensis]